MLELYVKHILSFLEIVTLMQLKQAYTGTLNAAMGGIA
jgi:hypothetical protein